MSTSKHKNYEDITTLRNVGNPLNVEMPWHFRKLETFEWCVCRSKSFPRMYVCL